jgi:hypothetical protein
MGEWFGAKFGSGATAANDGIRYKKTNSTNGLNVDTFKTSTASNGFTYVTSTPVVEAQAASAITGISQVNPAVVTQTNTYSNGDIVRIYNTTGDLAIAGMDFQISSASGSGYTLLGLANTANNGLNAATAGNTRRISQFNAVDPEFLYVTYIAPGTVVTAAPAGTIVGTSVDPSNYYVVGMKVKFTIPSKYGMREMDQQTGTITQLNVSNSGGADAPAYNFVVNIDSSSFSTFTFPASATVDPGFATVSPAGAQTSFNPSTQVQTGYDFVKQPFHTGQFVPYMSLSGGANSPAGANLDVINWMSYKLEV